MHMRIFQPFMEYRKTFHNNFYFLRIVLHHIVDFRLLITTIRHNVDVANTRQTAYQRLAPGCMSSDRAYRCFIEANAEVCPLIIARILSIPIIVGAFAKFKRASEV